MPSIALFSFTTVQLSRRGPKSWSLLSLSGWILYQLFSKIRSICNGSSGTSIHTLDNDSLLNIFHFCRPAPGFSESGGNEADALKILGVGNWENERWWYSIAQVCRRWRYLVLESASLLDLSLHCRYGTPVADMMSAHLPPLPLILDYCDIYDYINADDELGIVFALSHRDRVRRIRIMQPFPVVERLIEVLHNEFPILEYLFIELHPRCTSPWPGNSALSRVDFPKTFRAPRLCYLVVMGFHIPAGSSLFMTPVTGGPVTVSLKLNYIYYVHPNVLLQQRPVEPQQERQGNTLNTSGQSLQRAIRRRVTPYLRHLGLDQGHCDAHLLPYVTIRLLERLQLCFFDRLTNLISHRLQFTAPFFGHQRLEAVMLTFLKDHSRVDAHCSPNVMNYILSMRIGGRHFNSRVAHTAQVCHMLRTVFSMVKHLAFRHDRHPISSERDNETDRTQWRKLLRTFGNVETLDVEYGLFGQLSHSLQPSEGESPMDLLPELRTLRYSAVEPSNNAFAQFIDARQKAGHPIRVIHS